MANHLVWAKETVWYCVELDAIDEKDALEKAEKITDWGDPVDGEDFDIKYAERQGND